MSGKFGKRKGDGYERELAKYLDARLFGSSGQISRMPLSGGGSHLGGGGRADLLGTPTMWVEAKRTEKFSPYAAMAQSENGIAASKTDGEMPVVISRKNNMPTGDSLVVMKLSDWVNIIVNGYDHVGTKHMMKTKCRLRLRLMTACRQMLNPRTT